MFQSLSVVWEEMLRPLVQRPHRVQVAALCWRPAASGGEEVLLITSRDTGRWILPKGWPIDGKDGAQSALQEAWEEAGVTRAAIDPEPVGRYRYNKGLDHGGTVPVETLVYRVRVEALADDYPEAGERRRRWVSPKRAAVMVREPQLRDILGKL